MSEIRYRAYLKKQPGGRSVWGVLRREGRKQNFRTVGEGEAARRKAEKLAKALSRMQAGSLDATDRFLSWHRSGEPLPVERTVRDYARTAKATVAASTAARYRQFAERVARRLGAVDLRLLQKEDVGRFVRAEHSDGRAKDPTINACVLLSKREGRTVLLHPAARDALATWLEELRLAGYMTVETYVFQSRRGPNQAIGRVQAWRILKRAFEQAGLTGNLGTHSMRKTFADRVYDRLEGDLVKTAQALAHRSVSSTASYLTFRESEIDDAILSI